MFDVFENKIVTIEGADGTGKDTAINILQKKIHNSHILRFPDRANHTGQILDKILKKEIPFPHPLAFQSLMITNRIETLRTIDESDIDPELFLFCRYLESTLIYGMLDGIPVHVTQQLNSVLPQSRIVFILHGKKYRVDGEHYEETEKQKKISQYYYDFAKQFGWKIINNDKTPEQITEEIIEELECQKLL